MQLRKASGIAIVAAVLLTVPLVLYWPFRTAHAIDNEAAGYQAVLLDNNQVFYGKVTGLGSDFPVMTDVFYVQTAMDPQTKKTTSVLLRRGKEWHGPRKTLLNARHIVMVEPVGPGSSVAKLIEEANRK